MELGDHISNISADKYKQGIQLGMGQGIRPTGYPPDIRKILVKNGYPVRPDTIFHYPA